MNANKRKKIILLNIITFITLDELETAKNGMVFDDDRDERYFNEKYLMKVSNSRFGLLKSLTPQSEHVIASYFELTVDKDLIVAFSSTSESLESIFKYTEDRIESYVRNNTTSKKQLESLIEEIENEYFNDYRKDLGFVNLLIKRFCDKYDLRPILRKPILYPVV